MSGGLQGALQQGLLHKVAINILVEDGMLVERYVLQSRVPPSVHGWW